MAESAVGYVITKLDFFLNAEVNLQRDLKRNMESLQNEFASINIVLKDADKKADQSPDIKEWVRQVRKMAYQIEDVIDEYMVLKLAAPNSNQHVAENDCKVFILKMGNVLLKAVRWILELKPRHELATTINDIKAELDAIQRRKDMYRLESTTSVEGQKQGCQDYRGYYSTYVEDSELLGIDKPKRELIRMLKMEQQHCRRFVIAMVGMGGIGKTTLVQKVYEDEEVRKHFRLYAWISVSHSYNKMDILRNMFKQLLKVAGWSNDVVVHESDNLSNAQIIQTMRDFLQEQHNQRYLLVFDDIWDMELLHCIRDALPSDVDGRILLTTRQQDVARAWTTSPSDHVHELHPLPPNEAWDLFCIKTFGTRECPRELEGLFHQIVEKCEGLPLAIVAIGGFLSTKQHSYSIWSKLLNSLGSELTYNRELTSVKRILLLSYHELPSHLKPCYLYFGMFPEDYSIVHNRLIQIWMADGLVEPQRGKTLEEVGEEYLKELIQRNLVQVAEANPTGKHTCVRVHDILREITISELEETRFGQLVSNSNLSMNSTQFRRLIINRSSSSSNSVESDILKMIGIKSKIRCLISTGRHYYSEQNMSKTLTISSLVKAVPLLKVLDLEEAPINEIPEEVGNLRLLRLLNLRNTKVKELPKSIGRLVNLESIDMIGCLVQELPKELSQLHKLRHLQACRFDYDINEGVGVEIAIGVLQNLKELQKLTALEIGRKTTTSAIATRIIEELRNLKQLRELGISFSMENRMEVSSVLQEMKHLESLSVQSTSKDEIMDLRLDAIKIPSLQCLCIEKGLMHKLPDWMAQFVNLVSFGLRHSRLQEDPLPILQQLPNLVELDLYEDAYESDQLDFGNSGFQKLQVLHIWRLKALKSIKGSPPPLLREGFVLYCPMLEDVPPELQFLLNKK